MSEARSFITALVAVVAMSACASDTARPTADQYVMRISDNAAEHRFDITLKSYDTRRLCISVESWPNSSGHFTVENGDIFLRTGAGMLPAKGKLVSAYCPGGCGEHRIEPKGELHGFVSYDVFGDASKLVADADKELVFPVSPYYCR